MKTSTLLAGVVLLAGTHVVADGAMLYHLKENGARGQNGKTFDMAFKETAREPDASLAVVSYTPGGSVAAPKFILRGSCGMARARGQTLFQVEQLSKRAIELRVKFLHDENDADDERKVYSISECNLLGF